MNTLFLEPTDILFFRDGRPMTGSLSGHSAAWPLPNVVDHAIHAALHRSGLESHAHRPGRNGRAIADERNHRFGSVVTAGPFPVRSGQSGDEWFFPRPVDAICEDGRSRTTRHPFAAPAGAASSLPRGIRYAVADEMPPSKAVQPPWWSARAWNAYLGGDASPTADDFLSDADVAVREHQFGIEIDPETGSAKDSKFYSAHYLRLRPDWRLGLFANARDKAHGNEDLIHKLVTTEGRIVVGGQQRVCSARLACAGGPLALPLGRQSEFPVSGEGKSLVRWTLLTPAIWPRMPEDPEKNIPGHSGGWLPNWITQGDTLDVQLKRGDTARQSGESRDAWRRRIAGMEPIRARLVAAATPKPVVVTGWFSPEHATSANAAKPTHLATPAGAVYYFEAESAEDAVALAHALNWHGATRGTDIVHRRSTLLGEKGFGLGVCSGWEFLPSPRVTN